MKNITRISPLILLTLTLLGVQTAHAAVPPGLNYQAYLTNSDGSPVDSSVSITFAAYNVDVGGVPLWSTTESVTPENGLFTVTLGNPVNPFPAGLFDNPVYIGLFVAGEEMLPRRPFTTSAFTFKAEDANTLMGQTATELDQSAEVSNLESGLSTLNSQLDSTQNQLTSVAADVSSNSNDIASNFTLIASNDSRLQVLEVNPGDITGVVAGDGLSGGATSGSALLSIANGGITANKLAPNSVGPTALNSAGAYTIQSLTTSGSATIGGPLTIDSSSDITINDDFNGFRWRSGDGGALFASIEVREIDTTFRDNVRNATIFRSNSNGIGIGTSSPQSTHDVTIPSLVVTGNIDIGRERVATPYDLSSTNANCDSHGDLTCYYGNGTAVCPVGKKLLGGGTSGSSGLFGSVSISAPVSDTTYSCGASYDIANATRTCYAICARVD